MPLEPKIEPIPTRAEIAALDREIERESNFDRWKQQQTDQHARDRLMVAARAMQGLLARPLQNDVDCSDRVQLAVTYADELLAALAAHPQGEQP